MQVTLIPTLADRASWTTHEVADLLAFLKTQWEVFPDTARIYHKQVSKNNDVTPGDEAGIEQLAKMQGPFFVVIYPQGPAVLIVAAIVLAVAAVAFMPSAPPIPQIPTPSQRNQQTPSPNNELSERGNRPRINSRIPDIFGQVRSTPDLIAAPYKIFEAGREVEYAYMCVGRGYYAVTDVRDGDTLCDDISGISIDVYDPLTSPNSGDAPLLNIGGPVGSRVLNTRRSNSINGQVLRPSNVATIEATGGVIFKYPNKIQWPSISTEGYVPFSSQFAEGDTLILASSSVIGHGVEANIVAAGGALAFGSNFGAAFSNGGFIWANLGYGNPAVVPPGWVVGRDVTITQALAPSVYDLLTGSGHVTGSTANISGTFEITQIAFYDTGFGYIYVAALLDDPAAINANWGLYTGGVTPFGSDQTAQGGATFDYDAAPGIFNLDGTYTIVAVSQDEIRLDNPAAVNSDWNVLNTLDSDTSQPISAILSVAGERWTGPFVLVEPNATAIFANFVAPNGIYKDDGTDQIAGAVEVLVEITPVDNTDTPNGEPETTLITLQGSAFLKETIAATLQYAFVGFIGRCQVRAKRTTPPDTTFTGTVVDEVRWRDVYSVTPVTEEEFGNVTTVHSKTFATASALAVKERKLNMLVTRKLPERVGSTSAFTETLATTKRADAILIAICRDVYLGNRQPAELDVANIYDTVAAVQTYFGHVNATDFAYTFDNDNLSFEEMVAVVAQALHCVAYRRGSVIRLSFEKETEDSTLLFNHRNKLPGTELREFSFGYVDDNDGLEFTYVDPADDAVISIFLPEAFPAVNAKKVESVGVRNHLQAYFLAWRLWNRIQYQNLAVQFEGTQEADLLIRNERILVSDSTHQGAQDGEVIAVVGLELTLSQSVDMTDFASYVIFLQHYDGTVEAIDCTAGSAANKVVLADAPALALAVDPEGYARATFLLIGDEETQQTAFLVSEKEPQTKMTSVIHALNYDARYYANDKDYINEIITVDGYGSPGGFTPNPDPPYLAGIADLSNHTATYTSDYGGTGTYTASVGVKLGADGRLSFSGGPGNLTGVILSAVFTVDGSPVTLPTPAGSAQEIIIGEWLAGGPLNLDEWEVKVHQVSGVAPTSLTGATIETWGPFASAVEAKWQVAQGGGSKAAVIDLSLRDAATDTLEATGQITVSVNSTPSIPPYVSLLHFEGANNSTVFTDQSGKTWYVQGGAKISTAQFKYGSASGLFNDGFSDAISTRDSVGSVPPYADFAFGLGEYTVECWFRYLGSGFGNPNPLVTVFQGSPPGNAHRLLIANDLSVKYEAGGTIRCTSAASAAAANTWHHLAVSAKIVSGVRTARLFLNGTQVGSDYVNTAVNYNVTCHVSAASSGSLYVRAHIDELRIAKVAYYSANFTPPTGAFPN